MSGLALTLWLVFQQFSLPPVQPAAAPVTEFSADRALPHLDVIAAAPRPVGAPGHARTRAYLLEEIRRLGLEPRVQETSSVLRFQGSPGFSAGRVRNVIVRLPGSDPTGAIALDAHYDGAATGPAAGDCGSGVVTLLETLRALQAGPPLRNDLLFVFADAEEVGDLGAHAFATKHPWMQDVRLALNYESMGAGGPAYLYATSAGNYDLIDAYATAPTSAPTNSFVVGLFNLFPEQRLACDLQDYLDEGSAGYGFVFTGDTYAYHTRLDNVENLDPRTVQHLGDNTLALLRHFGNADLQRLDRDSEGVFFNVWPGVLWRYPASWALPLAVLGLLSLLVVTGLGLRRQRLRPGKTIAATFVFLFGTLVTVLIATAVWYSLKALNPNLQVLQVGSRATGWFLAGLLTLAAALMTLLAVWARPRLSFAHQLAGALTGFALLGLLLAFIYPIGTHLFHWPLLAGLPFLWWLAVREGEIRRWNAAALALLGAIPAVWLIVPVMAGPNPFVGLLVRLDALTGMPLLALDAWLAALLTGLLIPLIGALPNGETEPGRLRWILPLAGLGVALLLFTIGWSRTGFSSDYPRPESVRYELDADNRTARWITDDPHPGEWAAQFLDPADREPVTPEASLLMGWPAAYAAPAPLFPVPPPAVEIRQDSVSDGERLLQLRVHTSRAASMLQVRVAAEAPLLEAFIENDRLPLADYSLAEEGKLIFNYVACPPEGIELKLRIGDNRLLKLTLAEMSDGLPALPNIGDLVRPPTTMPALTGTDAVVVRKVFTFPVHTRD